MASLPIWQNPTSSFSRLSLTAFEPKRSFAGFTRLAHRHQYRPRDGSVISSLHYMNDPQPEGHILHRSTKILSHGRWAAAAWPLAARAEQSTMPVVGFRMFRPGSRLIKNAGGMGPGMAAPQKVEARR